MYIGACVYNERLENGEIGERRYWREEILENVEWREDRLENGDIGERRDWRMERLERGNIGEWSTIREEVR